MREYIYSAYDGDHGGLPVSKLSTARINELLCDGIQADGDDPVDAGVDQLRLELEIRTMEGRL